MTTEGHNFGAQPTGAQTPVDRHEMLRSITVAAVADPRIVGLVDYGSSSEGRADAWSDVDVGVFVRDEDFPAFVAAWVEWAGGFGRLLLSFAGAVAPHNYWAVYDGVPAPLRVDFSLHPAAEIPHMAEWPNAPRSVADMVLVDTPGGALAAIAAPMVRQDLGPLDLPHHFTQRCAAFWYYAVRTWCKLRRGPTWGVRYDITYIMLGILMDLLRLEAGTLRRWRASDAAADIEREISPERLVRLDACIPGPAPEDLAPVLHRIILFGGEVSAAVAARYGRPWPEELAARMAVLADPAAPDPLPPGHSPNG